MFLTPGLSSPLLFSLLSQFQSGAPRGKKRRRKGEREEGDRSAQKAKKNPLSVVAAAGGRCCCCCCCFGGQQPPLFFFSSSHTSKKLSPLSSLSLSFSLPFLSTSRTNTGGRLLNSVHDLPTTGEFSDISSSEEQERRELLLLYR